VLETVEDIPGTVVTTGEAEGHGRSILLEKRFGEKQVLKVLPGACSF